MNDDNRPPKMTDFDRLVSPEPIQLMKALIPYASPQSQRFLSLYAKAAELQNTLQTFRDSAPDMSICSASQPAPQGNPLELLQSLREYCNPATRQKMDECSQVLTMLQMAELLQNSEDAGPEGEAMDYGTKKTGEPEAAPTGRRKEDGTEFMDE